MPKKKVSRWALVIGIVLMATVGVEKFLPLCTAFPDLCATLMVTESGAR